MYRRRPCALGRKQSNEGLGTQRAACTETSRSRFRPLFTAPRSGSAATVAWEPLCPSWFSPPSPRGRTERSTGSSSRRSARAAPSLQHRKKEHRVTTCGETRETGGAWGGEEASPALGSKLEKGQAGKRELRAGASSTTTEPQSAHPPAYTRAEDTRSLPAKCLRGGGEGRRHSLP